MDIATELLQAISHPMSKNSCFVCGCNLTDATRTREDVVPKWIQKKYCLADQSLTLINGTSIPYPQLTVPCCLRCNGRHLSQIEQRVSEAVDQGYADVAQLSEGFLFQWMAKLFLGIVYKELFLVNDRSSPESGSIRNMDELQGIRILWFWLRQ